MIKLLLPIYLIFLFSSCRDKSKEEFYWIPPTPETKEEKQENPTLPEWVETLPENLKGLASKVKHFDVQKFDMDVYLNENIYSNFGTSINTDNLVKVDSAILLQLFGDNPTKELFAKSFLYSIEKPKLNFHAVTVFLNITLDDRPLMLLLFDSEGKFSHMIEVDNYVSNDNFYRYKSSEFINDSTMVQLFEERLTYQNDTILFSTNGKHTRIIGEVKVKD